MIDDGTPENRERHPERHSLEADARGNSAAHDSTFDEDRHYRRDPTGLLENARDEDERAADELLELDQRELEELGLVLDDPHQSESE